VVNLHDIDVVDAILGIVAKHCPEQERLKSAAKNLKHVHRFILGFNCNLAHE
jgi:hypothetical protein